MEIKKRNFKFKLVAMISTRFPPAADCCCKLRAASNEISAKRFSPASFRFHVAARPEFPPPTLALVCCSAALPSRDPGNNFFKLMKILNIYKVLTISPSRTTFSPRMMKMPRSMSPYLSLTWIRSTIKSFEFYFDLKLIEINKPIALCSTRLAN